MQSQTHGAHLHIRDVTQSWGARTVLHHIQLTVEPGEFLVVIGRSGCGKSTLLRLIGQLAVPSAGAILLDGVPLRGENPSMRMMFQDARLLPWKRVIENVSLGLNGAWRPQAEAALAQVGLLDRANEWPSVLSGGERQRVALARALVHQPPLLLLDEPLGALDALTRIEMQRLIERLWLAQRWTTILVTHDVEEAIALADRVVLIEHGHVAMNLPISLPRPRERGSAEFASLKDAVLQRVMGWQTS